MKKLLITFGFTALAALAVSFRTHVHGFGHWLRLFRTARHTIQLLLARRDSMLRFIHFSRHEHARHPLHIPKLGRWPNHKPANRDRGSERGRLYG